MLRRLIEDETSRKNVLENIFQSIFILNHCLIPYTLQYMSVTFALLIFFSFFLDKIFEGESPSARVQRWIVDLSKYIFVSDLR